MKKQARLPRTDSIQELASFWDSHDLADFEDQLEEITDPVFGRRKVIPVDLGLAEAKAVSKIAKTHGIADAELIRRWVRERLQAR